MINDRMTEDVYVISRTAGMNGGYCHGFIKESSSKARNPPPRYAVRLGQEFLKSSFKKYLCEEEYRNKILAEAEGNNDKSLLTINENFEIIMNTILLKAILKSFFVSDYLVMQEDLLKRALLEVYNEFYEHKNETQMDSFLMDEIEKFGISQKKKEKLERRKKLKSNKACK